MQRHVESVWDTTKGRKRHIVVDTLGLLIAIHGYQADIQDRDGGLPTRMAAKVKDTTLEKTWSDGAYRGRFVENVREDLGIEIEVVALPVRAVPGETPGKPFLNLACLVRRDRQEAFSAAMTHQAAAESAHGVALTVTGPWPPFTFVSEAFSDHADGAES
ncbi:MAG: GvpL/GvpF family gas vesicle protein [Candidatus Schekmanbacteria bacterium]|nr:GvpL/GvpF family gas vesicle protein [Candidatus Schekmanbacteria bacterium]